METKPVGRGAPIGEVARRTGLSPSALRYYERVGVLPAPGRENGRRRYSAKVMREVLDRLAAIGVAQQAGFVARGVEACPSRGGGRTFWHETPIYVFCLADEQTANNASIFVEMAQFIFSSC